MFVFATTEPRKIPITILSRCQRHDFRRIDVESISNHMGTLCAKEGVEIAVDSLGLIAREAGGSMRDGLSLLDHVISCTQGAITHKQILDILGVIDREVIFNLSAAILGRQLPKVLDILDAIYSTGHDMKKLYADLMEHFRNLLLVKMVEKIDRLVDIPSHEIDLMCNQVKQISIPFLNQILDLLFKEEVSIFNSTQPRLAIEMIFIRMFQMKPVLPIDILIEKLDHLRKDIYETRTDFPNTEIKPVFKDIQEDPIETSGAVSGTAETIEPFTSAPLAPNENINRVWERLLSTFSEKYPSLSAILKNSTIKSLSGHRLEIEVNGNDFNINMVRRNKNRTIIEKVCSDFFGKDMDVIITTKKIQNIEDHDKKNHAERLKQEALCHPLVTDTIDIFNGNVVDVKIL
jgi:DNA polymerase-3 subunit gamma/tau